MKHLMLAVAALLVANAAFADGDAPAAATETVAPPSCHKPVVMTKVRKADSDTDFNEAAEAYKNCINEYVTTQNDMARKHTDAANAAVDTFNAFLKEVNEKRPPQ